MAPPAPRRREARRARARPVRTSRRRRVAGRGSCRNPAASGGSRSSRRARSGCWLKPPTPSIAASPRSPCQCSESGSAVRFSSRSRRVSPCLIRSAGPGVAPSKAQISVSGAGSGLEPRLGRGGDQRPGDGLARDGSVGGRRLGRRPADERQRGCGSKAGQRRAAGRRGRAVGRSVMTTGIIAAGRSGESWLGPGQSLDGWERFRGGLPSPACGGEGWGGGSAARLGTARKDDRALLCGPPSRPSPPQAGGRGRKPSRQEASSECPPQPASFAEPSFFCCMARLKCV